MFALTRHPCETGCGLSVSQYWKLGSVDKKVPELQGVNLDAYRKQGSYETRITISK